MKKSNELLHLPDLKFSQYCEEHFSVNKGIYNTIDQWFYRKGITDILERREKIILFIIDNCSNKGKVKFGPGGLKKALEDFWNEQSLVLNNSYFALKDS